MPSRAFVYVFVLVACAVFQAPTLVELLFKQVLATAPDPNKQTIASPLSLEQLQEGGVFKGKRVLVVGGTRGIGRGIALVAAAAGAHVDVVGRRGGDEVVSSMRARGESGEYGHFSADLSTVEGCEALTSAIEAEGKAYDTLIMTVGVWPDASNALTSEGYERTVFIDVVARYSVFAHLQKAGMLAQDAAVMNVLASGQASQSLTPPEYMKTLFMPVPASDRASYQQPRLFFKLLATSGVSADSFLLQASKQHPSLSFVGTFPGFIATDLVQATFGKTLANAANAAMAVLGVSMTEEECGVNHLNILADAQVRGKVGVSLWDHYLVPRTFSALSADPGYGDWLMKRLHAIVFA